MEAQKSFALRSLILLVVGNGIIIAQALFLAGQSAVIALGGVFITFGIWFALRGMAAGLFQQSALPESKPVPVPAAPAPPRLERPEQPPEAAALQLLSILQRDGRLLDFLREDIQPYDDASIGAAVRSVHEGCRKALQEYIDIEPVLSEAEGSTIALAPGFDASRIRITGHVGPQPPLVGEVRHRGWRAARVELPELMHTKDRIIAPAEVEVA